MRNELKKMMGVKFHVTSYRVWAPRATKRAFWARGQITRPKNKIDHISKTSYTELIKKYYICINFHVAHTHHSDKIGQKRFNLYYNVYENQSQLKRLE